MTILKLAFELMPEPDSRRAFSATDVQVRLPVEVANPRVLTAELKARGLIQEAYRQGGQKFYVKTPGAVAPEDMRGASDRLSAAHQKRQKQSLAARARAMRTLKKLGGR